MAQAELPEPFTRLDVITEDKVLLASPDATVTNNNNVLAALIAELQKQSLIG